jgi:hypothetical protein
MMMDAEAPILIGSSEKGFIATWCVNYNYVYANVSTDGVTWQPASMQIGGTYNIAAVSGCGNNEMFLVAWNDNTTSSIYVATSTNNASSWNGPYVAVSDAINSNFYSVGCFANQHGFLLAYGDESSNLWSVFSTNGIDWGSPVLISAYFNNGYVFFPSVGGTDAGFVVAWAGSDGNAYASFSADNGTTWSSPPSTITSSGAVLAPFLSSVNISAYNNRCMASWMQSDGMGGFNALVSLSPFPTSAPSGPKKEKGGFIFPVTPNKPGFQLNKQ